ncbi:phosphate metabolism protein 7 [Monosporozyma unispora]
MLQTRDTQQKFDLGFDIFGINMSNYSSSSTGSADTSSSTSAFVSTFIVNLITAVCFFTAFTLLRTKFKRVYQPRTLPDLQTITEEERISEPPQGYFAWLPYLLSKPHSFLLQHCGIDGYFFLRYMAIFVSFSFIAACILFPILLPVNASNGHHLSGFEILSYANVINKKRLYAHVFLSWLIYILFMFILYRELYYYMVFRHAVQTTPLYDGLLSSRTVVLTELNENLTMEGELEKIYPNVMKVVFAHDLKDLIAKCDERTDNFNKLESALNSVINDAVEKQHKASDKKLSKLYKDNKPKDDLETYVPLTKRPTHRLGKWYIPPIHRLFPSRKKVETIQYCEKHIVELNSEIHDLQLDWEFNTKRLPAVFLIFANQSDAQKCFQSVTAILGRFTFGKKFIGVAPEDINWSNLNLTSWQRYIKYVGANTFMVAMMIFWAIPVAVVGCISNVNFLTTKVPFLRFINNLPTFLLGLITGLLPTIALAILMSFVPPIIQKAGKISGSLTSEELKTFTQKWFYAFQVIQVFLVTTLASSASATVEAIIRKPGDAMTLLANNLPKASNFYIVYFLLLGLSAPTGNLLQIANLVLSKLFPFLDSTPREKWTRYNTLDQPDYSLVYPTVQILTCIFITYIIISPIILVFSTFAILFTLIAYLYNSNYVTGFPANDARGKNYPMAMFQAMCPIYLCQVCLIGLFIMSKSWGPLVLEVIALAVTALCHIYYKWYFLPLMDTIPLSVIKIARGQLDATLYPSDDLGRSEINQLIKNEEFNYKENMTGGVIRDATKWELTHADLLPTKQTNQHGNSNSNESISSSKGPQLADKYGVWSIQGSTEGNSEDGKDVDPKDHERKSSTVTGATLAPVTTFVPEDEEFRKYTYKDVQNQQYNLRLEELERKKFGHKNTGEHVVNERDVGKQYSDPMAMMDDTRAFPPNIVGELSWWQRIIRFFQPSKTYRFDVVRSRLPHVYNSTVDYEGDYIELAYTNPYVRQKDPIVWICKDPMGVSQQQIDVAKELGMDIRDDFTEYNEKGKPTFTFNPPDFVPKVKR